MAIAFTTWFKPGGLPVFPPHDDPGGDCVLERLRATEPARFDVDWPQGFRGGVAHRLDVHPSGALLLADDLASLEAIRQLFARGAFEKTYRFLADKDVPWDVNRCDLPLAHDRRKKRRMVVQRGKSTPHRGKWYPASTTFRRIEGAVWEATMRTGVMHQIRAHAAFVGLPLVGDRIYGRGDGQHMLHHVGLSGGEVETDAVPAPAWARDAGQSQ